MQLRKYPCVAMESIPPIGAPAGYCLSDGTNSIQGAILLGGRRYSIRRQTDITCGMRIEISCWKCTEGKTGHVQGERVDLPIAQSNLYRHKCSQGHDVSVVLQNPKHEILAENAVWAIADGYHREGVASFAAALERFYEFYFEAVTKAHGIDRSEFTKTWNLVKSQSERQFGLYLAAYLFENKAPAPFLRSTGKGSASVEFRNKVVHKGHIPDEAEAIDFGQAVVDLIHEVMSTATDRLRTAITDLAGDQIRDGLCPLSDEERRKTPTMWINTLLSFAEAESGAARVVQAIELRRQDRAQSQKNALHEAIECKWAKAQRHFDALHEMLEARRNHEGNS